MKWFELTARESKKRMAEGEEVTCLTDAWIKAMIDARLQKENAELEAETRRVLVRDFSDREIWNGFAQFPFRQSGCYVEWIDVLCAARGGST